MKIHMVFLAPQGEYILNQKKNSFFVTRIFFDLTTKNWKEKQDLKTIASYMDNEAIVDKTFDEEARDRPPCN